MSFASMHNDYLDPDEYLNLTAGSAEEVIDRVLETYNESVGITTPADQMSDLIRDLFHYANAVGMDLNDEITKGRAKYDASLDVDID